MPDDTKDIMAKIAEITPGVNYPISVEITESVEGTPVTIRFLLNSFVVGCYMAIYFPNQSLPTQVGDYDNKKTVRLLKKEMLRALKSGGKVEIGAIRPIKKLE